MIDREKVIKELHDVRRYLEDKEWSDRGASLHIDAINDALELLKDQEDLGTELTNAVELIHKKNERIEKLLKEQDELLKHEYWRGYNNGRADERGLQEGTIMQTFSPD